MSVWSIHYKFTVKTSHVFLQKFLPLLVKYLNSRKMSQAKGWTSTFILSCSFSEFSAINLRAGLKCLSLLLSSPLLKSWRNWTILLGLYTKRWFLCARGGLSIPTNPSYFLASSHCWFLVLPDLSSISAANMRCRDLTKTQQQEYTPSPCYRWPCASGWQDCNCVIWRLSFRKGVYYRSYNRSCTQSFPPYS